jgi:NAD(P)-dependent dehydrogenase (short-subunit alcohol dehydrogenase family)
MHLRVAREIGGGRAQFQTVEVRDALQVQSMAANAVARFGRIDVLLHNAMNVPLVNRDDGRAPICPKRRGTRLSTSFSTVPFIAASTLGSRCFGRSPDRSF